MSPLSVSQQSVPLKPSHLTSAVAEHYHDKLSPVEIDDLMLNDGMLSVIPFIYVYNFDLIIEFSYRFHFREHCNRLLFSNSAGTVTDVIVLVPTAVRVYDY